MKQAPGSNKYQDPDGILLDWLFDGLYSEEHSVHQMVPRPEGDIDKKAAKHAALGAKHDADIGENLSFDESSTC